MAYEQADTIDGSPDPKKVLAAWNTGIRANRPMHMEAMRSLGFLFGEHAMIFDRDSGRIFRANLDPNVVNMKIPLIKPLWRREYAKMTKSPPTAEARPMSDAVDDRTAAEAVQFMLEAESQRIKFSNLWQRLHLWTTSVGAGALHPCWDAGDPKKSYGNVTTEVIPATELVVDPNAKNSLEEAKWIIHGQVLDKETAYDKFGSDYVGKRSDINAVSLTESIQEVRNTKPGLPTEAKGSGVLVLRYWVLPCGRYPEGGVWTIVDGKLVKDDKWTKEKYPYRIYAGPERDKKLILPFVDFHHIRLPGRFWGQASLPDLWSSQKDYDHARSRQWEARELMANPAILSPMGSIDMKRMRPVGGQNIEYRLVAGGNKPEAFNPGQSIPGHLWQSTNNAMAEMSDIILQNEASQGVTKAGSPVSAMLAAQAVDDSALAPIISQHEDGAQRYWSMHMQLVKQYWGQGRVIEMRPEEGDEYIARTFSKTDIKGRTAVAVVAGSAMPRSRTQTLQNIQTLMTSGVVLDPDYIIEQFNLPNARGLLSSNSPAVQKAKRENAKFAALIRTPNIPIFNDPEFGPVPNEEEILKLIPIVEEWNDHQAEIDKHNEFRMSSEFESLPEWVRRAFAVHVQDHETMLEEEQMKELQMQMQMQQQMSGQGSPGASGAGPSQPSPSPEAPVAPDLTDSMGGGEEMGGMF